MDQLLDLCITLTPPPEGSPSESIASITLSCDSLGLSHTSDLLDDPLTPEERDDLRWYLEEYWKWPYEGFAQRGREVEALLPILGKRLYIGVFGSVEADRIVKRWLAQSNGRRQISIISTIPKILSLPWELLHDESSFLALNTDHPVPIVRCLWPSEARMVSPPFELPLRVLLVTARPEKTAFIDPRGVARELLDELDEHLEAGTIEIEFLRPPTLSALRTRLKDTKRPIHVLHFDGHGRFEEEIDGQGMLLFEDNEGRRSVVGAEKLAQVLRRSGVRLVVLTACQSAMGSIQDAFSSVAAQLIRSGVDTVIAMGASVLAANVTLYVETFYREMAAGRPTSTAHEQAQQTLHNNRHRLLHRRQRDEEGQSVELCDWWLPQFYQQRPLLLQPIRQVQSRNQQVLASRSTARLNSNLPAEPHYGFYGRAYDLLQIERWLTRGKLVLISGLSGIGKTTLAREAADWLTRTRMYERACYISFEQGGDASTLLSVLGDFMEVYDSSYAPNESKASLAKLDRVLKEWRTLVIVDNLEGSLSNGGLPLTGQPGTRLWHLLLELVEMGAGVLLISRDTKYTDRRQGKRVAHLALDCLHPEDAYELAWSILDTPEINSVHVPYPELRDLLAQLDYHPLAIQLVLPKLRELPISSLRKELTALLPQFQDDAVAGQNGSLLASLEYSMHHLDEKQQALLYCLAPFEGWAREDDLLAITQMLKDEWDSLGIALEQTGLMTVERIPGIADRFLRFHPVLPPFLRGQPVGSDYTPT